VHPPMVGGSCVAVVHRGRARQGPAARRVPALQDVEALGIGCRQTAEALCFGCSSLQDVEALCRMWGLLQRSPFAVDRRGGQRRHRPGRSVAGGAWAVEGRGRPAAVCAQHALLLARTSGRWAHHRVVRALARGRRPRCHAGWTVAGPTHEPVATPKMGVAMSSKVVMSVDI